MLIFIMPEIIEYKCPQCKKIHQDLISKGALSLNQIGFTSHFNKNKKKYILFFSVCVAVDDHSSAVQTSLTLAVMRKTCICV